MKRGFTLLETLLVIASIAILAGISLPIAQQVQNTVNVNTAIETLVHTLRRAQALSEAVDGDISWGVHIQEGTIILFKGISYANRDTSFDDTATYSPTITPSGLSDVVFSKFTGIPQSSGIITFTGLNNQIKTLTLNEKGTITY